MCLRHLLRCTTDCSGPGPAKPRMSPSHCRQVSLCLAVLGLDELFLFRWSQLAEAQDALDLHIRVECHQPQTVDGDLSRKRPDLRLGARSPCRLTKTQT